MHRITLAVMFCSLLVPAAQSADIKVRDRDSAGLVQAIERANRSKQSTTIHLARHGLYTLTDVAAGSPGFGLPVVRAHVVIAGNQAEIRRYARSEFTLLAVAGTGKLRISDLTLAEGSEGALLNHGVVELHRVKIIDNQARHQSAIVENYGELRIIGGEISYNQLDGAERDAGTVINYGLLAIDGTEIAGNWISRRYDSLYAASAVLNYGDLQLRRVQINQNTAEPQTSERAIAAVLNIGKGIYSGSGVEISNNEPATANQISTSVARLLP